MQDEVAGLREGVAQRLRELEAAVDAKVAALSESTSKNVQLGARVRRLPGFKGRFEKGLKGFGLCCTSPSGGVNRSPRRRRCCDVTEQPLRQREQAVWLPISRLPASCCLQLVSMSKRSAALEGRLRETSAREGQLRSALQHTAAGGAAPPAAHAANGGRPVSLLPCVLMPLLDTRTQRHPASIGAERVH